ncbi:hypothetical protein CC78DRAFT_188750 [Lojkania enalia]|uniref:Uncharacterized protein n=1 Tax=Lojkania enalia TaxID=147567 RepID=A0A9P4TR53_9PLEO|nr:hypothetical protein CC78DRAFT_188750 [Didymosphaeria enalia]
MEGCEAAEHSTRYREELLSNAYIDRIQCLFQDYVSERADLYPGSNHMHAGSISLAVLVALSLLTTALFSLCSNCCPLSRSLCYSVTEESLSLEITIAATLSLVRSGTIVIPPSRCAFPLLRRIYSSPSATAVPEHTSTRPSSVRHDLGIFRVNQALKRCIP